MTSSFAGSSQLWLSSVVYWAVDEAQWHKWLKSVSGASRRPAEDQLWSYCGQLALVTVRFLRSERAGALFILLLSACVLPIRRLRSSPQPPSIPPEALLPVAAHLVQPPARSHSISLIKGRVCPFVHSHPHGRRGNNALERSLPASALTHPSSISWLQRQTLLLFSHAGCDDFTPEHQHTDSSTLSPFFSFWLSVTSHISSHTQTEEKRKREPAVTQLCPAGLTAQIAHLGQKDACARARRMRQWQEGETGESWRIDLGE